MDEAPSAAHRPHTLMAELLYDRTPVLDAERLLANVQRTLPATQLAGSGSPGPMLAHEGFLHTYADGRTGPILTVLMPLDEAPPHPIERDLSQTWEWPEAEDAMRRCRGKLVVAEMMGIAHEPQHRVRAFRTSVLAVASQAPPLAIWWPHSTRLVALDELASHELVGIVNVRLFNVEGDPGVVVMDTLGLHVLGLPDLQCHFRELSTGAMAALLYNMAGYLFAQGDVIESGNTVAGIRGEERWRCQHEDALVGPERTVLDIDPGDPFAAGQRDR